MESVYPDTREPRSFGGVDRLRRYAGKQRKQIVDYLVGQDAYTSQIDSKTICTSSNVFEGHRRSVSD